MNIIEQLQDAINELRAENCDTDNLVIKFSPLVKRYLEQMISSEYPYQHQIFTTFMGIPLSEDWPYNEIVVYDKINVCYHPKLLRKIPFEINVVNSAKITEVSLLPNGGYWIGYTTNNPLNRIINR